MVKNGERFCDACLGRIERHELRVAKGNEDWHLAHYPYSLVNCGEPFMRVKEVDKKEA